MSNGKETFKKVIEVLFVDKIDENEKYRKAGLFALYRKELADQVHSWRFLIVLLIIAITGIVSVYSAGQGIQSAVQDVTAAASAAGVSLFLYLFSSGNFIWFLMFLGPIVGLALGFDAINGERSRRTLTRLLAQPIHRDAVINGKFLSGLTVIFIMVFSLGLIFTTVGVAMFGIAPTIDDVLRIIIFLVFTVVYMSLWLALSQLFSLLFRRAATSILAGIAVWLFLSLFIGMIATGIAGAIYPAGAASVAGTSTTATAADQTKYVNAVVGISHISPSPLYSEASSVLLNPAVTTTTLVPTISQAAQLQSSYPAPFPADQAFLLVWPHLIALLAITFVCFIISYISFMRQEIRSNS